MNSVQTPTAAELRAEIAAALAELRMSRTEAERRATAGTLSGDEYWTLQGIRAAEYLLSRHER